MKFAYDIISNGVESIVIRDRCEQHQCISITNAAEDVIEDLFTNGLIHRGKQVFYIDTMNEMDELCHDGTRFTGFAPGPSRGV